MLVGSLPEEVHESRKKIGRLVADQRVVPSQLERGGSVFGEGEGCGGGGEAVYIKGGGRALA